MSGIGGFFPLERPSPIDGSVLACWTAGMNWRTFVNARSALAAAIGISGVPLLWIPSYICKSVLEGALAVCRVRTYPVNAHLQADIDFLQRSLSAGDGCLIFRAFGAEPEPELLQLLNDRGDVVWIEDCAQALDPGPLLARFRYFSPRKLLGVPEGGILVGNESLDLQFSDTVRQLPAQSESAAPLPVSAYLRAMDPGQDRAAWYDVYRVDEARQDVCLQPASRYSVDILGSVALRRLKASRVANYSRLEQALPAELIFPIQSRCRFGMVIRVDDAATVARSFHARGIFVQRHWPEVVGTSEHDRRIATSLLTLPIDHRLDDDAVDALIRAALEILKKP